MWAKKIFLKAFFLSFWAISVRAFFCQVFVFCIKVPPLNLRPALPEAAVTGGRYRKRAVAMAAAVT